ncbi:hypothetical protein GDI1125 [Gluconacetobacter diazotrophicus PA1 5]|uniref:Uncharacterized protein n=1 Tax=Gluconacetobacter diazotrophicus (strain ATCC 49037 / DSM 5601 / CCUG 37298 / CIP 103539 / LMG 7603 / PAl5) TaxID=272568 RepID=A9HD90_GLUDA|nr:hypothetical protein GDI1125 [Gluconacetobacter diazotrophicus PA1 5]
MSVRRFNNDDDAARSVRIFTDYTRGDVVAHHQHGTEPRRCSGSCSDVNGDRPPFTAIGNVVPAS